MTAPKDHNRGPAFDQHEVDEFNGSADEFLTASQKWLDMGAISNDIQAQQLTDQIRGLQGLAKSVEDARKAAKAPHFDAGKAVDEAYGSVKKKLDTCVKALKGMAQQWLDKKRAEEEQRLRKAAEEAAAAEAEAARLAAEAEAKNDLAGQIAAQEAADAAEAARKQAEKPADVKMKSMTGAGRTISERTRREAVITNARVLALHYIDRPELLDVLTRLANADIRAKDVDETAIPGIEIAEHRAVA